nr:hypothetical protein [Tanacetum cinerariifolium]
MNCRVTTTSPLPRSHVHALRDPHLKEAMLDEYNALISNRTWVLVPRPSSVNVVRSMWLFKHKFKAVGSLSRYKARLVANGRSQQQCIDCDETFSLVVKPATIRTILSLAVSRDWPIHQLDVKNAFFMVTYLRLFICINILDLLILTNLVMFVICSGSDIAYLLLYVDDIILTTSSLTFLQQIIASLHIGLFLSQSKFAKKFLERAHMHNCNPCRTLIDSESKLGSDDDPVCLYMHDPCDPHFTALKRIIRYVCGTLDYGLQLHVSSTTQLSAYTDADWAGCPVTRRSTSAEYRGVANVVAETAWIRNFLCELHTPLFTATFVYCDNVNVVYMSVNPVQHQRTKHIKIDIHFVRDFVASRQVRVLHVPSRFQYADIFTKGLPTALFIEFRSILNVRRSPAHTEGEY